MITRCQWRVVGASVLGASHKRTGKPNQDAIHWSPQSRTKLPLVLAVSDGHGSAICLRSDVGASLAVDVATRTLQEVAAKLDDSGGTPASVLNRLAQEQLPQRLLRNWTESVAQHLEAHQCSTSDVRHLLRNVGRPGIERLRKNPSLAYGATLLCTVVTDTCILYMQLGDGDIVVVNEEGDAQRAIPKDDKLIGNETTSLCGSNAWHDMRVAVQHIEDQPPAMILMSTDGYANSFRDDAGFLKVGPDLLRMIRDEGLDYVDKELTNWLTEASSSGSGDDVTLGIICRLKC